MLFNLFLMPASGEHRIKKIGRILTLAALLILLLPLQAHEEYLFTEMSKEHTDGVYLAGRLNSVGAPDATEYLRLSDSTFLYLHFGMPLSSGLFCFNESIGQPGAVLGGYLSAEVIHKSTDGTVLLLVDSTGGRRGRGWRGFHAVTVSNDCSATHQSLVSYEYDMESGMCGRGEQIGIDLGAKLVSYQIDRHGVGATIKFVLMEEECITGTVRNNSLFFEIP